MKKIFMGIIALLMIAIIPAAFAGQTRVQGTVVNDVATGGLAGTISLAKDTIYDTTNTTIGVTHATVTATFTTPNSTSCVGFYAGAIVNTQTTSGTFTLSCNNGNMIQGIIYGDYTNSGDNNVNYDAFIITPTPGQQGIPGINGTNGKDGLNGTNVVNGTNCTCTGSQGIPGRNGTNGTNGINCWDLNANQICNLATEDKNNDFVCNVFDCRGSQGLSGNTTVSEAFENCNSNDTLFCGGSKNSTLKIENYYCKKGFGTDSVCLMGQCKLKKSSNLCSYGCEDGACKAPTEWTSSSCGDWCKDGNDIPQIPCNSSSSVRRYIDVLNYCDWQ